MLTNDRIHIRVSSERKRKWERFARENGMDLTELIRLSVDFIIDNPGLLKGVGIKTLEVVLERLDELSKQVDILIEREKKRLKRERRKREKRTEIDDISPPF